MLSLFQKRTFLYSLFIFIFLNLFLYLFIFFFHAAIPFDYVDYKFNAYHYIPDPRFSNKPFHFLISLAQYDSQWYLKISQRSYLYHPRWQLPDYKGPLSNSIYAFFPFYPLLLYSFNLIFRNILLSSFIFSLLLLFLNFYSLYYVITRFFSEKIAQRTIFLLFLFPFSIFYRSYYTESLFLLFLTWFSYFFMSRKYFYTVIFLSFMNIIKANGWLFNVFFLALLWRDFFLKRITYIKAISLSLGMFLPLFIWITYCYIQTNNPLYFLFVRSYWYIPSEFPLVHLLTLYRYFFVLPFHAIHFSKLELITIFLIGALLFLSKKYLPIKLWYISLLLWFFPLLVTDTTSFTRYQIVSFPLFIFLALRLPKMLYITLLIFFFIGLCILSLYFVNWYWIG